MRAYDVILKKRQGQELTAGEIQFMIDGFMSGAVPDYQMSAFAMAIFFKGMNSAETAALTMAMVKSGESVDLSGIAGIKVDKHSTGGVGDKTTLVLGPLVAAAGVPVAKMSGRGLGHTGGTIDKLESIPGFKTSLTKERFIDSVNKIKIAITGQTGNITPADKKLYALRDVTATVDSIPLIASSIMSKKLAAGADAIVLDVKTGSGAFMKTVDEAVELAKVMVDIGRQVGRTAVAVITDMDEPLGYAVGNSVEVMEAIECLKGRGPEDLQELCLVLGSHMVNLAGLAPDTEKARKILENILYEGQGLAKLKELITNQEGDPSCIDKPELLPKAKEVIKIKAPSGGYVSAIQAEKVGVAAMILGAGRETKDTGIDLSVGVRLHRKVGHQVSAGDTMAVVYTDDLDRGNRAKKLILEAFSITGAPPKKRELIKGIVTSEGVEIY